MRTWLAIAILAISAPAHGAALDAPRGGPLLLDGRCDGTEWEHAARVAIGPGYTLLAMQDSRSVYLCVLAPADSHNTLDLYLQAADDARLFDLHASAQVGQRVRGESGWPEWIWWNHAGWYSPAVPFAGMKTEEGKPRPDFRTGVPREVQLDKATFGAGPWRVMLEVGGTRNASGEWTPVRWPADGDPDHPAHWASLSLSSSAGDVLKRSE